MDTAKDMYKVYSKTSTINLIKNRNRKIAQIQKIREVHGYFVAKERARLEHMIRTIDAVIEMRRLQDPQF